MNDDDASPQQQRTLHDVMDSIARERGGYEAFSASALIAARGLCRILNAVNEGDVSKAGAIAVLEAMLPPRAHAGGGGHIDLARLSDADLDALEAMVEKTGTATVPTPNTPEAMLQEALLLNAQMQELLDRANDRARIAQDAERTYKRVSDDAIVENARLRGEIDVLRGPATPAAVQTAPTASVAPPQAGPAASNVVPLKNSREGTLIVDRLLGERYPLHDLDPVGRW